MFLKRWNECGIFHLRNPVGRPENEIWEMPVIWKYFIEISEMWKAQKPLYHGQVYNHVLTTTMHNCRIYAVDHYIYCILASCYIRLTLNICSFVCYIDGQKNKYSVVHYLTLEMNSYMVQNLEFVKLRFIMQSSVRSCFPISVIRRLIGGGGDGRI
jgi:hypothetical protein